MLVMVLLHNVAAQRKLYKMCMLLNVGAHKVSIRNVKVSKCELHIMYSVTKRTASQTLGAHYVSVTKHFITVTFCYVL
jgi:hypothetical protein